MERSLFSKSQDAAVASTAVLALNSEGVIAIRRVVEAAPDHLFTLIRGSEAETTIRDGGREEAHLQALEVYREVGVAITTKGHVALGEILQAEGLGQDPIRHNDFSRRTLPRHNLWR